MPLPVTVAYWTYPHMGAYVRARRVAAGLAVHQLALKTGIDRERLAALETGWNTLGEHHWAALCQALPGVDRRVLEHFAARQNRPPWHAGPRRVVRRIHRRVLPAGAVFVAGTLYGALLIPYPAAAFYYLCLVLTLLAAIAALDTAFTED